MTSAPPRSILVLPGRYHIMSNASIVNNCILITVAKACEKVFGLNMASRPKVKIEQFLFIVEKSYNKTVIDFRFGQHEDLSTRKSDIYLGLRSW